MCQMKNTTHNLRGSNRLIVACVNCKTTLLVYTQFTMKFKEVRFKRQHKQGFIRKAVGF